MILVIGLGNPGTKFKNTPHNIGFQVIEEFARRFSFPDFRFSKKNNAEVSEGTFDSQKIILAKPTTFMNNSGKSISLLTKTYKLETKNLIVVHDDIDLPLGKIKIVKNRGAAGHKGVESIITNIKSKNFTRIRIGICPALGKPKDVEKFVVQKFRKQEIKLVKEAVEKAVQAIEKLAMSNE